MNDRDALFDWLKWIAELIQAALSWLRQIPDEIGAQMYEIRMQLWWLAFGAVLLVVLHAFITRKK